MSEGFRCTDPRTGDLLTAYQLGLLEEAERLRVEQHLIECSHCQELAYDEAPAALVMRTRPQALLPSLERSLATGRPSLAQRWRVALRGARRPRVLVPALAAAVLVVVLVSIEQREPGDLADLARLTALRYELVDHRAGERDPALQQFRAGMERYVGGDYQGAAEHLAAAVSAYAADPARASTPQAWQARLYLGLSHLLAGQPEAALPFLREATASPLRPVADHARWYAAQALLVQGSAQDAAVLLRELAAGSPGYVESARQQLEELQPWLRGD